MMLLVLVSPLSGSESLKVVVYPLLAVSWFGTCFSRLKMSGPQVQVPHVIESLLHALPCFLDMPRRYILEPRV